MGKFSEASADPNRLGESIPPDGALEKASVVSVASAVEYNPEDGVPRLLAKGRGRDAERIMALAREAGIEIVKKSALAALLDTGVKPEEWITPWCWEAVARILAFVLTKERK
jgi:flagellar biosynthesis protein FlhB